jgi:hypothetical protein
VALFPAELAKQGAQRGQSEADAAVLSRTCRSSASSATTTSGPTSRRASLLATSASLAISAERPAISECRSSTLAGAALLSVHAPERNQGSGLSGRDDGRPEGTAGLAAGDLQGPTLSGRHTRFAVVAVLRSERREMSEFVPDR